MREATLAPHKKVVIFGQRDAENIRVVDLMVVLDGNRHLADIVDHDLAPARGDRPEASDMALAAESHGLQECVQVILDVTQQDPPVKRGAAVERGPGGLRDPAEAAQQRADRAIEIDCIQILSYVGDRLDIRTALKPPGIELDLRGTRGPLLVSRT